MLRNNQSKTILDRLGFCKIDLVDPNLLKELHLLYTCNYGNSSGDMTVTHNKRTTIDPMMVHREIEKLVLPSFNSKFQNFKILASHFVVKKANSEEHFQLHQDWNVVDETRFENYQVWIPLDVSYPENGGICFVPESHDFYQNIRSGSCGIPSVKIEEGIHPYLSYLRLIPGEAAVFFSKTFHGSFKNSTKKNRIAVLVNIIQEKATPLYYHKSSEEIAIAYEVDTEKIFKHLPELEIGSLPFKNQTEIHADIGINELNADALIKKIRERRLRDSQAVLYESKSHTIFKEEKLERDLNLKGYTVIDLLKEDSIKVLRDKMSVLFPDRSLFEGTYSSVSEFGKEDRRKIHKFIGKSIETSLDVHFKDYDMPLSLFYSRKPDNQYKLEWHQDPSLILNEHLEPFYGVWCPLIDVNNVHGALKVIPGSHRWINKLNLAYKTIKWPFDDEREYLSTFTKTFQLKAGQAIVFDARLIHGSDPNKSLEDRDNIVFRLNHKSSKYFNIIRKLENEGELYAQDKNFFFTETLRNHTSKPETGKLVGKVSLFESNMSKEFIDKKIDLFKEAFEK